MGFVVKRNDGDDESQRGPELDLGLEPPRCETCRRELLPWETSCPDDGGRPVRPSELTQPRDPLLERLLAEEDGDGDGES